MKSKALKEMVFLILALGLVAGAARAGQAEVGIDFFYDQLAPYGEWVNVAPYGWVWCPYDVEAGWRPYWDGDWVYSDFGWTFVSPVEWGWAVYHYGRWGFRDDFGWFWVPGSIWGPSWVSWRHGDGIIGWAPLPPDVGWSFEIRTGLGRHRSGVRDRLVQLVLLRDRAVHRSRREKARFRCRAQCQPHPGHPECHPLFVRQQQDRQRQHRALPAGAGKRPAGPALHDRGTAGERTNAYGPSKRNGGPNVPARRLLADSPGGSQEHPSRPPLWRLSRRSDRASAEGTGPAGRSAQGPAGSRGAAASARSLGCRFFRRRYEITPPGRDASPGRATAEGEAGPREQAQKRAGDISDPASDGQRL